MFLYCVSASSIATCTLDACNFALNKSFLAMIPLSKKFWKSLTRWFALTKFSFKTSIERCVLYNPKYKLIACQTVFSFVASICKFDKSTINSLCLIPFLILKPAKIGSEAFACPNNNWLGSTPIPPPFPAAAIGSLISTFVVVNKCMYCPLSVTSGKRLFFALCTLYSLVFLAASATFTALLFCKLCWIISCNDTLFSCAWAKVAITKQIGKKNLFFIV